MSAEHRMSFLGYDMYRYDQRTGNGGVALLIVKTLDHSFIGIEEEVELQCVTVEVRASTGKFKVTSVYKAPNDELLAEDIDDLLRGNDKRIIIGDLNCKNPEWNSATLNTNGRKLAEFTEAQGAFVIGPITPTFLPSGRGRPDVLDIAIVKK